MIFYVFPSLLVVGIEQDSLSLDSCFQDAKNHWQKIQEETFICRIHKLVPAAVDI